MVIVRFVGNPTCGLREDPILCRLDSWQGRREGVGRGYSSADGKGFRHLLEKHNIHGQLAST